MVEFPSLEVFQKIAKCGTLGCLVGMVIFGRRLDWMMILVISNLNNSMVFDTSEPLRFLSPSALAAIVVASPDFSHISLDATARGARRVTGRREFRKWGSYILNQGLSGGTTLGLRLILGLLVRADGVSS